MRCPSCLMEVDPKRSSCGYCGAAVYAAQPSAPYSQPEPTYYPPSVYMAPTPTVGYYPQSPVPLSNTPVVAGIMLIIGGLLAMIDGSYILAVGAPALASPGVGDLLLACASIMMIFAIFAIIGGFCALQRRVWGLALFGSVFCMLSIGPMAVSSILGLFALILVAMTKNDFG